MDAGGHRLHLTCNLMGLLTQMMHEETARCLAHRTPSVDVSSYKRAERILAPPTEPARQPGQGRSAAAAPRGAVQGAECLSAARLLAA